MADKSGKWDDLIVRLGSAVVMVGVGLVAIWIGGWVFGALVALIGGAMIWELVRLIGGGSQQALMLAGLSGLCLLVGGVIPAGFALPLLMAPAFVGLSQLKAHRTVFMTFSAAILLASFGMVALRQDYGMAWLMWLVLVVVVTDVAGYFAGRMIGGPKFWPRVSPKKTWSGTVAGWIGAALIGLIYWLSGTATASVIGVSIAVSMASQMGDIAESAVKRRVGVKDASTLIPGHGGLLDRFDGMLGAALFLLLVAQFLIFPAGGTP
ncbi:phosphatidate cytidylyltransferase [Marinovum sp.]|uniref:phosphatidate cytidylyltransferase n=1 Tax=Marinovum sp. TaxID=2024839 RepID=UPI003A92E2D6